MKKIIVLISFLTIFFGSNLYAKKEIRLGVFAYLGYEKTKEKYEPLVAFLNSKLQDEVIILEVLKQEAIDYKIANKTLDIVTTNPMHYISIRAKNDLQGVLATLLQETNKNALSHLGGVIIVNKNNTTINSLADIKGKRVSAPSKKHMGGYIAQMYELQKVGITEKDFKSLELVEIHQHVVHNVLKNEVDVGFIRNGVLEQMIETKEINLENFRIINQKIFPYFPFIVSTEIYPEWPIFALAHTDQNAIRHIASALYSFDVGELKGIAGYAPPSDYSLVERLVREMRLPPYDLILDVRFEDIWQKYMFYIIGFLVIGAIFVGFFVYVKRKADFTNLLLESVGDGIYGVGKDEKCVFINQVALATLGFSEKEVLNKDEHKLFHHHTLNHERYDKKDCPIFQTLHDRKKREMRDNFIRKDGSYFPVELTVAPVGHDGVIVIFRDVSESVAYEQRLEADVQEKTMELKASNDYMLELLNTDPLTGIMSRRFFFEHILRDVDLSIRNGVPLALLMLDIDFFKSINDTYGHAVGDDVLRFFCKTVSLNLRKSDLFARIGGEEFVILCYNTNHIGAMKLAEKIRHMVAKNHMTHNEKILRITCSIGVSLYEDAKDIDLFLKNSDDALYKAKNNGRNRVESYVFHEAP